MYDQAYHPLDLESVSSKTSNATSRATTIPNSWSATTLQEKLNQLNQYNIHPIDDDQSSTSTETTARFVTMMNNNISTQRNNVNPTSGGTTQNQPQPAWVNPYWGPSTHTSTTAIQSATNSINNNANTGDSSVSQHAKQLIPGSILINDHGEIDDLLWKQKPEVNSRTSTSSFNPGGQYISDESGGTGGYLAPTHTQRRPGSSLPDQTAYPINYAEQKQSVPPPYVNTADQRQSNQPQTLPETTNNNNNKQPWVNPYWPKSNQNNSESRQNGNSQPSNNSKTNLENKPASNTKPPEKSTTSNEPWQNPYGKTKDTSKQSTGNTVLNQPFFFPHKVPPIPSFYYRIYPPSTPLTSPVPTMTTKDEPILSSRKSEVNVNDDEDLPYTLDSQGIAHYRAVSSAPNATNRTSNLPSASTTMQYPGAGLQKSGSVSFARTVNTGQHSQTTSSAVPSFGISSIPNLFTNVNSYPSSSFDYHTSSKANSATVLTETELNSIHDALHLLETNPNAIPVLETSRHIPSSSLNNPLPSFASLFTANQEQRQPAPLSRNVLFDSQQAPLSRNGPFDSQQAPLFSTPSYPSNSTDPLSRFTSQGSATLI